ncbi:MAG: SDR family oxidoreductase [Salinivirgaceae bacterium]|jgi:NADP-dependent 3-hydroxy acid dehydrogenase YdfG|nr:SDR family oxidoreductase [Salinivirgaceae bacterium]
MKNFKDKVVVITGASSGIGKALAFEFSKLGALVSLGARRIDRLEEIKKEIETLGGTILITQTDVSYEFDCKNLMERTVKRFGIIDILINNAGISMRALFTNVEISVLKRVMDVNFWGTVYCTKYALPYLLEQKGVVVGVSSIAGFHGLPGRTGYCASKFAIHGFLETLRIEYLKQGLHVMVIAPGFTASEVRKHALNAQGNEQGETPRKEEKMMAPERVAQILIRSIKRRKRNKILTLQGQIIALFQRILPEQIDALIYRGMRKEPNSPLK